MTIIPKSQIDAANEVRLALAKKKQELADIIVANAEVLGDSFVGTSEQIASVQDANLKAQLESAFNACLAAAEIAGARDSWLSDIPGIIKNRKEMNKNKKNRKDR